MKTTFPYGKIDFDAYLQRYFEREDAITALPSQAELEELARKAIVKEQLVLTLQPEGTCAEVGDTLTLSTVSQLPKFNKPSVSVSIGRGLYDRGLEMALVGLKVGESCTVTVKDTPVQATVLQIKRKSVPEPTDEMVVALEAKNNDDKLITTVGEYVDFIVEQKTLETLANVNYYVMEGILQDHPIEAYDEEDIRILGDLERVAFHKLFLEHEGVDLYALSKEEMREKLGCDTFDDFIEMRHEWYKMKIQQCLIFGNILGIPMEGEYDPVSRYEVLSDLQMKMFDRIKEELIRRNG